MTGVAHRAHFARSPTRPLQLETSKRHGVTGPRIRRFPGFAVCHHLVPFLFYLLPGSLQTLSHLVAVAVAVALHPPPSNPASSRHVGTLQPSVNRSLMPPKCHFCPLRVNRRWGTGGNWRELDMSPARSVLSSPNSVGRRLIYLRCSACYQ
jgi:hypothetical protein